MNNWKNTLKCLTLMLMLATLALGCSKKKDDHADEKAELIQITVYSDKTELFMEFNEPVAEEKTPFLIHLTRLSDWQPVAEGALRLIFTPATGAAVSFTVAAPVRPGVYQTELTLAKAGEYALAVIPEGKGYADRIEIPELHVVLKGASHKEHAHEKEPAHDEKKGAGGHDEEKGHGAHDAKEPAHHDEKEGAHGPDEKGEHAEVDHQADQAGADHNDENDHHGEADHHDEEDHHGEADHDEVRGVIYGSGGGSISFPKAQQWNTEFMSRQAQRINLGSYFKTAGELVPVSNREATVSAPLAGVISGAKPLPFIGKKVAKGEVVAFIEPPFTQEGGIGQLTAGYAEAKNRVTLALNEYARAKRLHEAKIAPLKRVEEAELALSSAKAALEPLQRALQSVKAEAGSGRIAVRAPVSGTVVEIAAANGKGVEAGAPILRIINTGTLWLKASLPAADAGKAALASGATFTVTGLEGEFRPSRLVTVNDMLDPQTRTLSVIFEVPNPAGRLKVGMFADVSIRTGAAPNALAVPEDALVEDEGRWFLFIQTAGETFDRREVKVGAKDKGQVQITAGLKDDERVVVKGAYYVKLAATAGKAADPHAGHGH